MSIVSMLERVESDALSAWGGKADSLDKYTEEKLTTLVGGIELRLKILAAYYYPARIEERETRGLRLLAVVTPDLLGDNFHRDMAIHALVTKMITALLEDNYNFINNAARAR